MGTDQVWKSAAAGILMQAVMVMFGKFVPAIGTMPNFYAIAGTVLAALTGAMAGKGGRLSGGTAAVNGATAGGLSSVVGGLLAVATGQWPGFQILQILFPALSGGIGGAVGGLLTSMTGQSRRA